MIEVTEYRVGRCFIRKGDAVKVVLPGKTQKKASKVVAIRERDGEVIEVDVIDPKTKGVRTVTPDRVHRVAQSKGGVRKEVKV